PPIITPDSTTINPLPSTASTTTINTPAAVSPDVSNAPPVPPLKRIISILPTTIDLSATPASTIAAVGGQGGHKVTFDYRNDPLPQLSFPSNELMLNAAIHASYAELDVMRRLVSEQLMAAVKSFCPVWWSVLDRDQNG